MNVYVAENYTGFKVFVVLLVLAVVALVALFSNIKASHAMGMDTRSNACHTYHVFAAQKEQDKTAETDGVFCGSSTVATVAQDNVKVTLSLPVVTVSQNTQVDTESDDTPAVNAPANGNPGNDKSVGSAGEKCDKSMCENSDGQSGEHGKSAQD